MFNILQFYEAGKARSGTALIPIKNASTFAFYVSTRIGDYIVDKGDGSTPYNHTVINKNKDFTNSFPNDDDSISSTGSVSYSSPFTGNMSLKFPKALKDIYSVATSKGGTGVMSKLNIADIETFFKQFPNLYSVFISEYSGSTAVIKGDLSRFPNSVEKVLIGYSAVVNSAIDFTLNLSNYSTTSILKYFYASRSDSPILLSGNLGNTPSTLQFLNIQAVHVGSAITYTSGKVWASSFDTLFLPIPLPYNDADNLFIDLDNSVTTAIGSKSLTIINGYRTGTSDARVSSLITKGFTVNCKLYPITLLINSISNGVYDNYLKGLQLVGSSYFDADVLKCSTGNYAYLPYSTSFDFGTGSLEFGCTVKFGAIGTGTIGLLGKSSASSLSGRYAIYLGSNNINVISQLASNISTSTSLTPYKDGNYHDIKAVVDRALGTMKLYVDGVLKNTATFTPSSTNLNASGNFNIGAYGNDPASILAGTELIGWIKNVYVNKF